jgi:tetratricopeptide (TPR) repeat protein
MNWNCRLLCLPSALAIVLACGVAAEAGAKILPREQALQAIQNPRDVQARRQGAEALGETGLMVDVPLLTEALRDPDAKVRALAEQSLWQVWSRSGDAEVDRLFLRGVEQMQRQDLTEAIETFGEIIRKKPDFAEGWNKRATLYYLVGEYAKSLADCDEVMKRNPVHFGALSGYGMIYLQLGKPQLALPYFEHALAVNPNLAGIEQAVRDIEEYLKQQQKGTI